MRTRDELNSFLDGLKTEFMDAPGRTAVEEAISAEVDTVIHEMWSGRQTQGFALMAVGGYGRGVMHPCSDIDLLFFFKDTIDEETIKVILHPAWSLPFAIGHQIRHTTDFKKFDESQMESYTAFLDARFLVGNAEIAEEFRKEILPSLLSRSRDRFLKCMLTMRSERYARFGETIFQLEPDLKDSPGGLRDAHWSEWVRKVLDENGEMPLGPDLLAFHHCVRNFLHFKAGRNLNVLSYEFQEQIAGKFGYQTSLNGDAAENLMRDYFLRAGVIARRAASWEEAISGRPQRLSVASDFVNPMQIVELFEEAHRRKLSLDASTLAAVRSRLRFLEGFFSNNPAAGRAVLEMMKDRQGIYETLLAMHDVGLLGKIFPEFEEIRCRVIRDFFHRYTVDEHSLIAIRNIEQLTEAHRFGAVLNELEHSELLLMALLFHDIGKARRHDEGNHVHPSTEGVKGILKRLELPEEHAAQVIFVIQNHLEMSRIILRRDFSDEHVIDQFADLVGTVDNLRMLLLLTYADVKAVNNEVLTPWKEDLLWQLYVETYNRLTHGMADDQYAQQPALESEINDILGFLPRRTRAQDIRDFLDGFPRQYLRNTPKSQIGEHFLLSRKLAEMPMVMHLSRNESLYELLVMTEDRPFLFSKITGVLSYFGMNIVRGQAFSNHHGTIFDLIAFEDPDEYFTKNPSERDRFTTVLSRVITGGVEINDLLRGKMTSIMYQRQNKGAVSTTIHFDDDFSKRCTILELVTHDAFGLLSRVSNVISTHGCNIEVVLINTEGPRAIDVFYLTVDSRKVSPEVEAELELDLYATLADNG